MDKEQPLLCYFEGQIIPLSEAKVGILTHGFSYGTACFEGIRAYWNEEHEQLYMFRAREHYERLHNSSRVLMMDLKLSPDELTDLTADLIRKSGIRTDTYIRPSAYKASEVIGVRLHDLKDEFYITVQPFGNYIDIDRALHAGVSTWRRVDDNMIPARAKIRARMSTRPLPRPRLCSTVSTKRLCLTPPGTYRKDQREIFSCSAMAPSTLLQ